MTTKKLTDYLKQQTPTQSSSKIEQAKPAPTRIRFKKETEFQETPIGKIPREWTIVTLSQLIVYEKGKRPNKLYKEKTRHDLIPYLKAEYLRGLEPPEWCEPTDANVLKVSKNDIIMIWDGSYSGEVFTGFEGALASTMVKIKPLNTKLVSKYLYYWLRKYYNVIHSTTVGTGVPHVNRRVFENLLIPIPSQAEQERIAEFLSVIDSAIEKVRLLIDRAERLKKGLMRELLTKGIGHKEYKETPIGKIPKEWRVMSLGELYEFQRGLSYRREDITDEETDIEFITIDYVEKGGGLKRTASKVYLKKTKASNRPNCEVNDGDLLIAITDMTKGDIIGAPLYVERLTKVTFFSMDLVKLVPKTQVNNKFVYYYLTLPHIRLFMRSISRGTTVLHLNLDLVKKLRLPIPPLFEQEQIAGILSTVDKYLEAHIAKLEYMEHIKRGLMEVLLTGRVRVIAEPS